MGTRNLTCVYMDCEYRVAQYGQWDGYPEGQGLTCLRFLRDEMDEPKFRKALALLKWVDDDKLRKIWEGFGMDKDGSIRCADADRLGETFPEFDRDVGAGILSLIQNDGITSYCLKDSLTFAADGLFCEWAWVIDLDKRTFEAYEGWSREPLKESDRFYFLREYEEGGYSGVHMTHSWSLDDLPTDDDFLLAWPEEDCEC